MGMGVYVNVNVNPLLLFFFIFLLDSVVVPQCQKKDSSIYTSDLPPTS